MSEMSGKQIVERAGQLAEKYEKTCTGCAQSAVAALIDALELEADDVFKAASGLADGIGLTGDGSCGSLLGSAMVIGLVLGRDRKDHRDMLKPMKSYLLCKELHGDFMRKYGSCRCHDIQRKVMGRTFNLLDPEEFRQAWDAKMFEHCAQVVGHAVRQAAELILRESEGATSCHP